MTHRPVKEPLSFVVCVCSTSRYASYGMCTTPPSDDRSGKLAIKLIEEAGHTTSYVLVSDDERMIDGVIEHFLSGKDDVLVLIGGTGLTSRDITIERAERWYHKPITGFGELFRLLSFHEVGTAAMLSRASAGVRSGKAIFCVPGSSNAVELAFSKLILPEVGHVIRHARE